MSVLRLSFLLETLQSVLAKYGIYLLETLPDGQTRWGDRRMEHPFRGLSAMANPYVNLGSGERYDIFTIRGIVEKLGKAEHLRAIEGELYALAQTKGEDEKPPARPTIN